MRGQARHEGIRAAGAHGPSDIAKVLDAGATDSGRPFFVMELVQGIPITRYCDLHKLSTRARLELFTNVCHAVQVRTSRKTQVDGCSQPARVSVGQLIFRPKTLMVKNPTVARPIPDQCDINCLAAFIEAAEELQREPFYASDNKSAVAKQSQNGETQFGDRFHFRSALIGFRQLRSEASSFLEICRLLKRFDAISSLDGVQRLHKEAAERRWANFPLGSGELVDLWLEVMFGPTQAKSPKQEKWRSRIEFARLVKTHGQAFLENVCRSSISAIGSSYFALLKIARPALARWEKDYGVRPEFEIGVPFGQSQAAAVAPNLTPAASAPAEPLNGEARLQKFERVLALDQFKPLKAILDSLQLDHLLVCESVTHTNSYQDLMAKLGYKIVLEPQIHYQDCYSRVGRTGGIRAVLPYHDTGTHSTLVTLANFNSTLTTTPKTAAFFNLRFTELKTLLKN